MSSFFSCKLYLREKSCSSLAQQGKFLSRNHDISNFFSKMAERWGINIYFVWKTTIVPYSVCRAFFSYKLYLREKSRSFLAQLDVNFFQEMAWHKLFFLKMAEIWGINIYFVWKTTIVHLSVGRAFFSYKLYLRYKSRSSLAQLDEISLKKWHHISYFLSKWRKAGL